MRPRIILTSRKKQFNEKNEQIAEATAAYFQDERLSQLAHLVLSPEFTAVREQMSWGDDRTKLDELVMSSGLSEFESRAREMLTRMQNVFAIDSTYIAACDGKACYFVLGPRDYGLLEGEKLQYSLTPEQCSAGKTVNLSYSEFVEKGTYGSERTTYYNGVSVSPIGEKDGEYTYWMASESDILLFMVDEPESSVSGHSVYDCGNDRLWSDRRCGHAQTSHAADYPHQGQCGEVHNGKLRDPVRKTGRSGNPFQR